MSMPTLRRLAAGEYQQLRPIASTGDGDEANGWTLAHFCAALWAPVEDFADLISDQPDGTPGWAILFDPDRCPARFLPHLAQRVGVRIPAGTTEATARDLIRTRRHWGRGTVDEALIPDVQATLTGTRYVYVLERDTGPHHLTFFTKTSETPNPAATLAAAKHRARKRIGLLIEHELVSGQTWHDAQIADPSRTWAQLQVDQPTKTWAQALATDYEV